MSSTLPAKDYQVAIGDRLCSRSSSYLVEAFVGQGTFGTVAKCTRMCDKKTVAIKMMKNRGPFVKQAEHEVAALLKLKSLDSDKCNFIKLYQDFVYRGYICFEFEHLDKSLSDFLKERNSQPLLLKEIRPIVQQIATALHYFKAAGMMHADLKLENVMMINHKQEPYRVKVIDFGLARQVSSARRGSYIQSRHYRSPEVLLGLPMTEAIDMWSLGCIAATLYLGAPLYPGQSEYDMMRYIVETQGQPSDCLLDRGIKTGCFFWKLYKSDTGLYELKTPEQYRAETGIQPVERRRVKLGSQGLHGLLNIHVIRTENSADTVAEMSDQMMFVDMLNEMLQLDATKRITPRHVLEHQFITMRHMASLHHVSSHVRSCYEIMDICCKKPTASHSGNAVSGSFHQPSSRTGHSVQQKLPPPSAERRYGPSSNVL